MEGIPFFLMFLSSTMFLDETGGQVCTTNSSLPNGYICDGLKHILTENRQNIRQYCGYTSLEHELDTPKVAHGEDAHEGEIPYIASLVWDGIHQCGGVIIDNMHLITAAHCLLQSKSHDPIGKGVAPERITVVMGTNKRYIHGILNDEPDILVGDVDDWSIHESYRQESRNSFGQYDGKDIAILTLTQPIVFSKKIWPICLGTYNDDIGKPNSTDIFISGFGSDGKRAKHLLQVGRKMMLISEGHCKGLLSRKFKRNIHDGMLCTVPINNVTGSSACQGDSGGPLVQKINGRHYLLGLVSYGPSKCRNRKNRRPDVYTDTRFYEEWVTTIVERYEDYDYEFEYEEFDTDDDSIDVMHPDCGSDAYCFQASTGLCTYVESFFIHCDGKVSCSQDLIKEDEAFMGGERNPFEASSTAGSEVARRRGTHRKIICRKWVFSQQLGRWRCRYFKTLGIKRRQVEESIFSHKRSILICPVLTCNENNVILNKWSSMEDYELCPHLKNVSNGTTKSTGKVTFSCRTFIISFLCR